MDPGCGRQLLHCGGLRSSNSVLVARRPADRQTKVAAHSTFDHDQILEIVALSGRAERARFRDLPRLLPDARPETLTASLALVMRRVVSLAFATAPQHRD
jgi:hypothetical protein